MRFASVMLLAALSGLAADKVSFSSLTDLAKDPDAPAFREALVATLGQNALAGGTAWVGEGTNFIWAVEAPSQPSLQVDDQPRPPMKRISGTNLWFETGQVTPPGKLHWFEFIIDGKQFGGNTQAATTDATRMVEFPVFGPDSYPRRGAPQGKLSEKLTFTSKIYEGMTNNYYIYVPAEYNPSTPAALMVWQDGTMYADRDSPRNRTLDVLDNLIYQKKIPVMIGVFIDPGQLANTDSSIYQRELARRGAGAGRGGAGAAAGRGGRGLQPGAPIALRSIEYDTVDDRYARYLRDELLPEVYKLYNIRRDAYSRAITGLSSGGICALNVAWQQPDQFSRVITWIGSYTGIQWRANELDGGQAYPTKVRKEPKRNIRIWLQDGANDLENNQGSWPLQAVEMANSFKFKGYDFHFSFGRGTHNPSHGSSEFPAEMTWLWRDYDPAKTEQTYEMDPAEKSLPFFRISSLNRETQ
jgi:enterochelin esterase-like enzyme